MESIKKYSYDDLSILMIGKYVHFVSDCELIPDFDVTVKVLRLYIQNNETIIETLRSNRKKLTIGSHMKNLEFEIVKSSSQG